jgi:hypothetical protein
MNKKRGKETGWNVLEANDEVISIGTAILGLKSVAVSGRTAHRRSLLGSAKRWRKAICFTRFTAAAAAQQVREVNKIDAAMMRLIAKLKKDVKR